MKLRRIGNKSKIAGKIIQYFPPHEIYIEMFFGGGGLFFAKPPAKYNFCNDFDNDVYNLYTVLQTRRGELIEAVEDMPYHEALFWHWMQNEESDPVRKALRFLMLSEFSYLGMGNMLSFGLNNSKALLLKKLKMPDRLKHAQFLNCDFRDVLQKISFRDNPHKAFIYADPPYLGTGNNYSNSFTEKDTADLFGVLVNSGIRFALSEFAHPFVLEQAESHGLHVHVIGERQSLKKRDTEILITNYLSQPQLF